MTQPATPHRKLTPEAPAIARELAASGLPVASIAAALGVHRATLHRWCTEPEGLGRDLGDAIQQGRQAGELALVQRLRRAAGDGDTRAATWLLTHAPGWRETWSDAAAERRTERRTMALAVEAIAGVGLPPDQERAVLLALQAKGLGAPPEPDYLD